EPLQLRYKKALYGPYAENLRHVLRAVEGHFITGYADGGDQPTKRLELVPGAVDEAAAVLTGNAATRERFDRVADLVAGFETPCGLELLSTVHWVARHGGAATAEGAVRETYAWGTRKQMFSSEQVSLAYRVLGEKGWLA